MEVLNTDRLRLRPLTLQDADWIASGIANPNVLRWLTSPPSPYRQEDAVEFVTQFGGDASHRAILRGDEPVGVISLAATRGPTKELGYWIKEPSWGHGYVLEAARAVLADHWSSSKAPVISGWIQGNAASAQILGQLGFSPEAPLRRWAHFHGQEMPLERVRLKRPAREMFTCRTGRLRLNALTMEDLPVVQRDWGQPEIARMMGTVTPNWSLDEARVWLSRRCIPSEDGFGRAIRLQDGTLIGSVGIGGQPRTIGYLFGKRHWGKGYASEALGAFLPAALEHFPQLEAVDGHVYDDNPASAHVLRKLGFEYFGPGDTCSVARVEQSAASAYRLTRATLKV